MKGTVHAATAVLLGTAVALVSGQLHGHPAEAIAAVALFTVGAVVPDIDHPAATISSSLGPVSRGMAWAIRSTHGHRRGTHSILAGAIAGFVLWLLPVPLAPLLAAALAAGWLLHLVEDATTPSGVALFWPLTSWRLRLGLHASRRNRRRRRA